MLPFEAYLPWDTRYIPWECLEGGLRAPGDELQLLPAAAEAISPELWLGVPMQQALLKQWNAGGLDAPSHGSGDITPAAAKRTCAPSWLPNLGSCQALKPPLWPNCQSGGYEKPRTPDSGSQGGPRSLAASHSCQSSNFAQAMATISHMLP